MTVQELLAEQGLTTALIVDDAYDRVPRAEDIANDDEAWSNFIADIGTDHDAVVAAFPAYDLMYANDLRHSDEFVAALWGARSTLRPELWSTLFDTYERSTEGDRRFLKELEARLEANGIKPIASGRTIVGSADEASVIFADLFLGAAQQPEDINRSIQRLQDLLRGREMEPPLVILMSRSNVLEDRKHEFRDKAKLLGAMFRVSNKAELLADSTLEKILRRLAQHRPDAIRVARFLRSWEVGLDSARDRFLTGVRRLDLSDYVQVQQVLLNFEGQPLGSYLLDIFDRVLQHEIEGDQDTISAAEKLNNIAPDSYPVPYIAISADLQDLVYRVIWQNPRRLQVKTTECSMPVGFGDVLIRKQRSSDVTAESAPIELKEGTPTSRACEPKKTVQGEAEVNAFVVMTPACDLTRGKGAVRVLLLAGRLAELTSKTWNYKDDGFKTPIIELPGDRRLWIKWDPKDLRMLLPSEISDMVGEAGSFDVVLRLRESNALELQQRLLSNMGRVGLLAHMPATFSVAIEAQYFDVAGNMAKFDTPILDREGGVCFTGRNSDGDPYSRLVLTDQAIDELITELSNSNEQRIGQRARDTFKRLQLSRSFEIDLQRGLEVPPAGSGYRQIKCATEGGNKAEVVGLIARNPKQDAQLDQKFCAFVLVLRDLEEISGVTL